MSETFELTAAYPTTQPWGESNKVEWINDSEPHLMEAGLVALGFGNGAVFLASPDQKIKVGDQVRITQVDFGRPNRKGTHPAYIVCRID